MEQAVPLRVPLVVDVRTGLNWGEMAAVEKNSTFSQEI
jgi:hypothetical protein